MLYQYSENDKGKKKKYRGYNVTVVKELQEDDKLCGVTGFKKANDKDLEDDSKYDILAYENEFYRIKPKSGKDLFPRYIKVSNDNEQNMYVRLKHDWLLLLLILCLVLSSVLSIVFVSSCTNNDNKNNYALNPDGNAWDGNPYQNTPDAAQETISILVPNNLYVSSKQKFVKFINPPENTVYLKFTVYDLEDNLLAETGDVAPGNVVDNVDLYSVLKPGQHTLRIRVDSHDIETLEECQGTYIETLITVD